MATIVVLGGNFAGITAALETRKRLGKEHKVLVVSPSTDFLYVPSLIWVPFGRRKISDITFDIVSVLEKKGVEFLQDVATRVRPDENIVETAKHGEIKYDYVVVATGVKMDFDIVPNLHPEAGMINNIVIPKYSEKSFEKFETLVKDPGPVVVGATQSASCMGAAYEYLFNMEKMLRKRGVRDRVELTWITPEPYLGHFGIDGMPGGQFMLEKFMKLYKINYVTDAAIDSITPTTIHLKNGKVLPYKMAMLMPPFVGTDVMRNSPELVDAKGFVETNDGYQHIKYKNVYAAGLAVQVKAPFKCESTPFGVPKTGFPSDYTGKIAAKNIVHQIKGEAKFETKPWGKIPGMCVMDAGNKEILLLSDHLFKPRKFAILIPNIFNSWNKLLVEKYMIWKNKRGLSWMP